MTEASNQQCPAADIAVGDALRNTLFGNVQPDPDDLISRNIQRGRDHGIPSYGVLREACGLSGLEGQTDIDQSTWAALMTVYKNNPSNIDAYSGGLAEKTPPDGLVGPLFSCIIKRQLQALRDGDRFFFTHPSGDNSETRGLKPKAKKNILGRTLADVMCDNIEEKTGLRIQKSVFKLPDEEDNEVKQCRFHHKAYASKRLEFKWIAKEILEDDPIQG